MRNGSGVYSLPAPPSPFQNGQTINATDMMTVLNDVASALTGSAAADGQTPITGNWTFGKYTLTANSLTTTAGVTVGNGLNVASGSSTFTGSVSISDTLNATGTVTFTANLVVGSGISSVTTIKSGSTTTSGDTLTVSKGGAAITGNSTVTGTLTVSGTVGAASGTKAGLAVIYDQFPATLSATGTETMPSGRIMKWGSGTYTAGTGAVSYAAAFPNGTLQVFLSLRTSGAAHASYPPGADPSTFSTTGFTVYGGTGQSGSYSWLAIGW